MQSSCQANELQAWQGKPNHFIRNAVLTAAFFVTTRRQSQLPLLGMRRSLRRGVHRYALGPEWIARAPD